MKKIYFLASMAVLLVLPYLAQAQNYTQTIKGQVIDAQSHETLPGVNIVITDSDPVIGTSTDMDGDFRLESVPVGRISLQITFIGYETVILANLELTSGKELHLEIEMTEQVMTINEVVISAAKEKSAALNEMATVSTRQFSIEESQRFAGARNDVSRMAQNFAGVRGANDAVNDIVIRGNSPVGLLWRLEGIDIPNPNHFGDFGSTGGPVSMLNNNVLSNSDFLTGAFPAEYGNAVSGVFDLRLRKGNNEHHEFLGQIGLNGFEFGAEGPFSKNGKASYLVNYRYSTLGIMSALGINFGTGTAIPYYQDITFNLNFPTKKAGNLNIWGMGGVNQIDIISSNAEDTTENFYVDDVDVYDRSKVAVMGATHTYLFKNAAYTKFSVAASTIINRDRVDSISTETGEPQDFYFQNYTLNKISTSFYYKKKFSAKDNMQVGIRSDIFVADIADSVYVATQDNYEMLSEYDGATTLLQPYMQWQHRFTDRLTLNTGLHLQYLTLNGSSAIEPRAGVRYDLTSADAISFAYGLHSMMAPIATYFKTVEVSDNVFEQPNQDIDFIRSHHFVAGYDHIFSETLRLRFEGYYQFLYDVLIDRDSSSFSAVNAGSFSSGTPDYLTNDGIANNIGAEFTLEKFMDKGLYFLITASIYDSKYTGSDGIERHSAFAGNYVANFVGGKEFNLPSKKLLNVNARQIVIDTKVTAAGGQRYTPIDLEASIAANETRFDWDKAFSEQFSDYFRWDLRAAYKINGKKTSQEFAFDVQNITNRQNPFSQRFNPSTGEITTVYQLGIFPVGQYRITF